MNLGPAEILTHAEARRLVRRAIDKTEELKNRGVYVAVDESGAPVTLSRMDGTGPFAVPLSRAKAYCAAALRENSSVIFDRLAHRYPGLFLGYRDFARDRFFAAQGAMLIERNGAVVGALSTGASIGPFVKFDSVAPEQFIVEGAPANLEDLIVCFALGVPYQSQHGDDAERWIEAYGKPASEFGPGRGFDEAPPASAQIVLDEALALADAVIAEAERRDVAVSVVVTDRNGDQIQLDRMDGAAPMTPDIADACAVTAVNFRATSRDAAGRIARTPGFDRLGDIVPYKLCGIAGGVPVFDGGRLAGGIGVAGPDPDLCESIAAAAVTARGGSISG